MRDSPYAPFYDLFKLIVAILLLLIFLFLTIWIPSPQIPQSEPPSATPVPPRSTPTVVAVISSPTQTTSSVPSTQTSAATTTPQATPSPTETSESVPSSTPTPTETPTPEPTTPPIANNPSNESVCVATTRTRLQVGMKAIIQHRLNFRSTSGIRNNRLSTNPIGTQVDVIGGPECTAYENGSSYLWWEIKLPNGDTGWSAEASAFGGFYFMEPVR